MFTTSNTEYQIFERFLKTLSLELRLHCIFRNNQKAIYEKRQI